MVSSEQVIRQIRNVYDTGTSIHAEIVPEIHTLSEGLMVFCMVVNVTRFRELCSAAILGMSQDPLFGFVNFLSRPHGLIVPNQGEGNHQTDLKRSLTIECTMDKAMNSFSHILSNRHEINL